MAVADKALAAPRRRRAVKSWVRARQDIIWIDCNPQAGTEMRDLHTLLVLSPQAFNARTGLVIGLPMTTAAYNASNLFAAALGSAGGATGVSSRRKTSYVLCHQPKSFDWRARAAVPHPLKSLPDPLFEAACGVLNQIIALG